VILEKKKKQQKQSKQTLEEVMEEVFFAVTDIFFVVQDWIL